MATTAVYRTTSESNVLSSSSASCSSSSSSTSISHSHKSVPLTPPPNPTTTTTVLPPQDYVVVSGQKYKLRKSFHDGNLTILTRALDEAHKTIELQALEIKQQNEYILKLEKQLSLLLAKNDHQIQDLNLSPSNSQSLPIHDLNLDHDEQEVGKVAIPADASPRSQHQQPNRMKNRLQAAIESTKEIKFDELDSLFDGSTASPIESKENLPSSSASWPSPNSFVENKSSQLKFPIPSLYIAHDNPQLGKIIFDSFPSKSTSTMSVMIETKDASGSLRIILGEIIYSGVSETISLLPQQQEQEQEQQRQQRQVTESRGGQCLVCVNMTGFIFSLNVVERRILTTTTDINLSRASIVNSITFESESQIKEFFQQCCGRVDIILSPSHEGEWYPYWENSENYDPCQNQNKVEGIRKLAPQFRSSGVGYLRLGDDMSSFGTSFLSSDSLVSFFDNQQTPSPSLASTSASAPASLSSSLPSSSSSSTTIPANSENSENDLVTLCQQLSESDKWSDRCRHLKAMAEILKNLSRAQRERIDSSHDQLTATLTKELTQNNLQVLKEALICVDNFIDCWVAYPPWGDLVRDLSSVGSSSPLSRLMTALLQLIRHSNRSVVTSTTNLLKKWFEIDANDSPTNLRLNHGSSFFSLVGTQFHEAMKLKPTGFDVLLHWLADLISLTAKRWCHFFQTMTVMEIYNSLISDQIISNLTQMLTPLMHHRDEKTREAALLVTSHLLALTSLWFQLSSTPPPPSLESLVIPSSLSVLLNQITPPSAGEFLHLLSTHSSWKRSEGKLFQIIDMAMRRLMSDHCH